VGLNNELYFASQPTSVHGQQIAKNPQIALAIFDSHQKEGTGVGLQIGGVCKKLETRSEIVSALKYYQTDFFKVSPDKFLGKSHYRLYKIVPANCYLNDPRVKVDRRVKVDLI
jgi:uncharacterized protein YhbP (UPF0306 family)